METPPPIWTIKGFMYRFYQDLHKYPNNKACYEALALELEDKHSVCLFSSYNAFRIAKHKLHKNKSPEYLRYGKARNV